MIPWGWWVGKAGFGLMRAPINCFLESFSSHSRKCSTLILRYPRFITGLAIGRIYGAKKPLIAPIRRWISYQMTWRQWTWKIDGFQGSFKNIQIQAFTGGSFFLERWSIQSPKRAPIVRVVIRFHVLGDVMSTLTKNIAMIAYFEKIRDLIRKKQVNLAGFG